MAAIDKVCELTGDYPSYKMYGFKRNQLQIIPTARKRFRGAGNTLYVQRGAKQWLSKQGFSYDFEPEEMNNYLPPFTSMQEFIAYKRDVEKVRLLTDHKYAFVTNLPELKGEVDGIYINWSSDLSTVKRKMKRLLRCRRLHIIFVDDLTQTIKNLC